MDEKAIRILLVEDNELNRKVVRIMLEELHCQVDNAATGEQALALLDKNTYDLALMDVGLPDINGLQVTQHIRERLTKQQLPVVGLTAHVHEQDIRACLAAEMNDVLTKPLSHEELQEMLSKWVTQWQGCH